MVDSSLKLMLLKFIPTAGRDPYSSEQTSMERHKNCWFVYILSSLSGTLYVGMTDNLPRRMGEHRQGLIEGFTKKYKVDRLMYYESFGDQRQAAMREKQIKGYRPEKKIALFAASNPQWKDLTEEIYRLWAV